MFSGAKLAVLVGAVLAGSVVVILLEWNAISGLASGGGKDGAGVMGRLTRAGAGLRGAAPPHPPAGAPPAPSPAPLVPSPALSVDSPAKEIGFPKPPEVRHPKCIERRYDLAALPHASIVIPYLNETWKQVSATVASMLAHTPMEVVDTILFVDDGNSKEWQYHDELRAMHPKIQVHRNEQRQGLIRSKVIGADLVSSPVVLFSEPHCIVVKQWLEPLLERLSQAPGHDVVVVPIIDVIPEHNFEEYRAANHHIGGFDWSLMFNWMTLIEQRNKSYTYPDPYPTPALSGGILAMWRDYWNRMGTYDTNMTEWGGEHIEMSLRTWRCGGRIEVVPCSRMGHVFRERNPYVVHNIQVVRNQKRVALVWLEDHLEQFYAEVPHARNLDAGDVSKRVQLKESLQCKSMDWYIDNVYPELREHQPRRR